ncbi:hypothetical protein VTO42DRAFT_4764 [Malbranchea cinnamomea]
MQAALGSVLGPRKEIHDLSGRVAVVTGGSKGIGFEVARSFLEAKARVILISSNEEMGSEALKRIRSDFGESAQVEWHGCDLGNLKQTREVVSRIAQKEQRLDLLILSAGINATPYELDHDGIERLFGVDWLGQYYVVNLFYPLLRKTSKLSDTPPPRIVFESSEVHRAAPSSVSFNSLEDINNSSMGPTERYGRAKLAMILGAKYGLVEKVIKPNGDNIYAISVHPGAVNTAMQQQWKEAYPGLTGKLITNVNLALGRSPEQGACSALYAATSPEIEEKGWNGVYLSDVGQLGKESSSGSDPELGDQLWKLSEKLVKEKAGQGGFVDWSQS